MTGGSVPDGFGIGADAEAWPLVPGALVPVPVPSRHGSAPPGLRGRRRGARGGRGRAAGGQLGDKRHVRRVAGQPDRLGRAATADQLGRGDAQADQHEHRRDDGEPGRALPGARRRDRGGHQPDVELAQPVGVLQRVDLAAARQRDVVAPDDGPRLRLRRQRDPVVETMLARQFVHPDTPLRRNQRRAVWRYRTNQKGVFRTSDTLLCEVCQRGGS